MAEERRLATILFADIVGSTSLTDEHDPEFVRAALREVFALLRSIVEEHGGAVEKFIGDEVMAVFGAPIAHEDDAERAIRAAFAMRGAVEKTRVALDLRIGVNSGEVVAGGEEDVFVTGRAVNAASRIRQAAAPDEILVGALTRDLTGRAVTYGESRSVSAKGLGSLDVWPAVALVSAIPQRRLMRAARLIGRNAELAELMNVERRMRDQRAPALVTVFGPPGIGKSRLAAEFADAVGREQVRVGNCLPYGQAIAFWPLREIVHADVGITPDDPRELAREKLRSAVEAKFPDSAADAVAVWRRLAVLAGIGAAKDELPDVPSSNLAQEQRWAIRRYLERRARNTPLVIVIEDAQWADPALLDTIDHLAEWAEGQLLLLCLARPELLETRPSWGAGRANASSITLPPLSEEDAHRLVQALLPVRALPQAVRDEIVRRADGNPLYIEEFVRMLEELGETGQGGGMQVDRAEFVRVTMPPSLQSLIAARLDRLSDPVRETLKRAAIVGLRFAASQLADIAPEPLDVEGSLAEASRRDFVVATDEAVLGGRAYRFRHALIREVAYRGVPKATRWRLHDATSRWIERASGDRLQEHADLVAHHAEQAYWTAAEVEASQADALGARAFDELLSAATRWRHTGLLRAALELYERAARLGQRIGAPAARLVEARGFAALARCYVQGARTSVAGLDAALGEARGLGPSEVLVRLASQRAFMARTESLERSAELFAEGITAAQATGDVELIAHATLMSNAQPWMLGDMETHERVLREADTLMTASGSVAERGVALAWLTTNALQRGDFRGALILLDAAERLAEASGSRFQQWAARRAAARDALAMGETAKALEHAQASLALARDVGARRLVALSCARLGDVLYALGEHARSRAVLEEGLEVLDPETMRETVVETQWKLSRTCLALGDIDAARTHANAAAANVGATDLYSSVTTRAALAAVAAASGDIEVAESQYREAVALAARTGYRALTADVQRAFGAFLLERGRGAEARGLLGSARAFFATDIAGGRRAELDALLATADALPRAR
jgi:class 3 adenylate cyclase/tetratricopeptide (TPR) repeat protein